ncbi:sarcosine oxidase subunit gamma [Yunchengibacter salinarum]|uniref:sarcosine oxidase subunit gamma n=1 Tax=Yunchengibacter salinarum TaxID=3133399 RepID=UPI0035B65302
MATQSGSDAFSGILLPGTGPLAPVTGRDVTVFPIGFTGLVSLRVPAHNAACLAALETALGLPLPRAVTGCRIDGETRALRVGPDEWLIMTVDGAAPDLAARLEAAGAPACQETDLPVSAVDVSDTLFGFRLSGAGAADLLARGCSLDLVGREGGGQNGDGPVAVMTLLDKARALILCGTGLEGGEVWVRTSFAAHMHDWFAAVADRRG